MIGIDPELVSTKELVVMIAKKYEYVRSETAEIVAAIYNVNRDVKKKPKPFLAFEINPYISKAQKEEIREFIRSSSVDSRASLMRLKKHVIDSGGKVREIKASSMKVICRGAEAHGIKYEPRN